MIFVPNEIASIIEGKLNETQINEEYPLIFRTDTIAGRFNSEVIEDEGNVKRKFVYSIVTDPYGTVMALQGANSTTQSVDLKIMFKHEDKNRIIIALNKFLSLMAGLYMNIPGTNLVSGINTKAVFSTSIPIFSEPFDQNIETVDEYGVAYNETFTFIEATIRINMTTASDSVMMGNEISYSLSIDGVTEKLLLSRESNFGRKSIQNTEQYLNHATSETINSANNFQVNLSFFVNGDVSKSIFTKALSDDYNQNDVYKLDVYHEEELICTKNVILTDVSVGAVIGGYTVIQTTLTIADSLLESGN